ncbi:hypothetical protein SAMD00079811_12890 [Scytonema sp. HK-05]|nr:hypothetical protein SAMD00079811_12890 [Scytonema sp. HK-05]
MEPVVTKRLIIRRMTETDLLDFLTYQTHPEVLRYMPVEPLTEERAQYCSVKENRGKNPGNLVRVLITRTNKRCELTFSL